MSAAGVPNDPWNSINSANFAALWQAVLAGDEAATAAALELVRKAVEPLLKASFPCLDPTDVSASVQRTLLRNLLHDASAINAGSLAEFFAHVRARARNKALNRVRKLKTRQEVEFPEMIADSGSVRIYEPVDTIDKPPAEAAMDNELVDALLDALDRRGEPDRSIVLGHANGRSVDEIAETLKQRGYNLTTTAIGARRRRVIKAIGKLLGAVE